MKTLKGWVVVIAVASAFSTPAAFAGEPHMERALEHLQIARVELQKARYGSPEHKVKALERVDAAIHQVHEAMGMWR